MKPYHTLLFIVNVFALAFLVVALFPKNGIRVYDELILEFPTMEDFFSDDTLPERSLEDILQTYEPIDSTAILDSLQTVQDSIKKAVLRLQYANSDFSILIPFFKNLAEAKNNRAIRVLHYGDSQIEGDRLTSYLRHHLQQKFGGFGPGLLPGNEVIPSAAIRQDNSPEWKRYTLFGKRDTAVKHNRYGVLANFARFAPILSNLVLLQDRSNYIASIRLRPSRISYSTVRKYTRLKLFYGYSNLSFQIRLYNGFDLVSSDIIYPSEGLQVKVWDFPQTPADLKLEFEGKDSPELYALSLESPSGVLVDNIAMRGSSGTIFSKIDARLLRETYQQLNVKLIILQFGGNTVPYLKDTKSCKRYGEWFKAQIRFLRKILPAVPIIVIGPSDMSKKEKDRYVSYPFVEKVRDALKEAAFSNQAAYWDLYEVMGGKNTMPLWVNSKPPLATKDYVHFTHRGVKKIAMLFYDALIEDYQAYENSLKK